MDWLQELAPLLRRSLPVLAALALGVGGLALAHWLLIGRHAKRLGAQRVGRQAVMLLLTLLALLLVVLAFPMDGETRGQVLGLTGLVLTAVIALSSTTFVANAMAGLMLRAVGNFRLGDFVRIEQQFGRVTEVGLFHTEIQTADRDLTTLPNLYLISHPVTVVRASGTITSTTLSLGYDVPHARVEELLEAAAAESGLQECFVQVLELGNFAITYRVAGFLADTKQLISARSRLRVAVLDALHAAGIEIVSPSFMNQRQLPVEQPVLPTPAVVPRPAPAEEKHPEKVIFDKAERAGELDALREEQRALLAELAELERARPAEEAERAGWEAELARRRQRVEAIDATLRQEEETPTS